MASHPILTPTGERVEIATSWTALGSYPTELKRKFTSAVYKVVLGVEKGHRYLPVPGLVTLQRTLFVV